MPVGPLPSSPTSELLLRCAAIRSRGNVAHFGQLKDYPVSSIVLLVSQYQPLCGWYPNINHCIVGIPISTIVLLVSQYHCVVGIPISTIVLLASQYQPLYNWQYMGDELKGHFFCPSLFLRQGVDRHNYANSKSFVPQNGTTVVTVVRF